RHFIQACPGAFRIDSDPLKAWDAVGRPHENFLHEGRIKLGFKPGCLLGIIPRQQKPQPFRPEMEAVGHVDNHGSGVRELVEGLCRHEHATERFDRQIDAHEACDFRRPRPCTVDDYVSGNGALAGFNRADPCALAVDSRYLCSFPDLRAVFACPGHQAHHGAVRIYKTIAGAEAATNDIVATQLRKHTANVIAGDQLHVLEAKRNLALVVSTQISEMLLVGRAEKIALRPISARISEPFPWALSRSSTRTSRHPAAAR